MGASCANSVYSLHVGPDDIELGRVQDPMTYDLQWLQTWQAFFAWKGTIVVSGGYWKACAQNFAISLTVAILAYNLFSDPNLIDVTEFQGITSLIHFFCSFTLGFFLISSVDRWLCCISGFLHLFNSIRCLSMQLLALGVGEKDVQLCLRYAVLSAKFLIESLRVRDSGCKHTNDIAEDVWATMKSSTSLYTRIDDEEHAIFLSVDNKTWLSWLWVSSLIGNMAQEKEIPAMDSPTYGRIMNICQRAQDGIRQVQESVTVQMHYLYVHMVSVLVQLICILLSVTMGLSVGVGCCGIRNYTQHYYYGKEVPTGVVVQPLTTMIQSLIVSIAQGVVFTMLYQAFFELAIMISTPFSSSDQARIPMDRMLEQLQKDLRDSVVAARSTPKWDTPHFKLPPKL